MATKATKKEEKKSLGRYFRGVKSEFKKVVWPSKDQVFKYSLIVIITSIIFSLLLSLYDKLVVILLKPFFN